jgi:hypothetical protein
MSNELHKAQYEAVQRGHRTGEGVLFGFITLGRKVQRSASIGKAALVPIAKVRAGNHEYLYLQKVWYCAEGCQGGMLQE